MPKLSIIGSSSIKLLLDFILILMIIMFVLCLSSARVYKFTNDCMPNISFINKYIKFYQIVFAIEIITFPIAIFLWYYAYTLLHSTSVTKTSHNKEIAVYSIFILFFVMFLSLSTVSYYYIKKTITMKCWLSTYQQRLKITNALMIITNILAILSCAIILIYIFINK